MYFFFYIYIFSFILCVLQFFTNINIKADGWYILIGQAAPEAVVKYNTLININNYKLYYIYIYVNPQL